MPPQVRVPRAARGGKPEDVRRHNLGTLLGHVHESGPLSRTELAGRMGLNRSTIAGLVAQLAELGLVDESVPDGAAGTRPGAGRPSLVVGPRRDGAHVLAVDIGVGRVVVAVVGLGGEVISRRYRRLGSSRSPVAVARVIRRLVESALAEVPGRVVGLGVAVPGVVRHADGLVRFAPNLGWVDAPLGTLLSGALDCLLGAVRVQIANDADLGVLAEHLRGVAVGYDDVVFIAGEVGVGGGCIVGGRPLVGSGGYAGELGHLPLVPEGRACRCGARGCWETEIGGPAIARALGVDDTGTDELVVAVRAAREAGSRALDGVARYVGRGLAGVVNLLNPQLVVLGGVLGEVFTATSDVVHETLAAGALTAPAEQVRLVRPALGADAVLVGAAELAWEGLLADPAWVLELGAEEGIPVGSV
jgi:predicted NBD/HSP70 family sugar kinase